MENYNIYVLEAEECIADIHKKLGSAGDFVYCEIMYRWDKSKRSLIETKNKNQIICSAETIEKLVELYPEYNGKIQDYEWDSFPYPKEEKFETKDLHISGIPNDFSQSEAVEYVHKRLERIISKDDYKVVFELRERNGPGFIHGFGKIVFGENVPDKTKFFCKIVLHNKLLLSNKGYKSMVSSIWHKHQQTRTFKHTRTTTTKKSIISVLSNGSPVVHLRDANDENENEETKETVNETEGEEILCVTETV